MKPSIDVRSPLDDFISEGENSAGLTEQAESRELSRRRLRFQATEDLVPRDDRKGEVTVLLEVCARSTRRVRISAHQRR